MANILCETVVVWLALILVRVDSTSCVVVFDSSDLYYSHSRASVRYYSQ